MLPRRGRAAPLCSFQADLNQLRFNVAIATFLSLLRTSIRVNVAERLDEVKEEKCGFICGKQLQGLRRQRGRRCAHAHGRTRHLRGNGRVVRPEHDPGLARLGAICSGRSRRSSPKPVRSSSARFLPCYLFTINPAPYFKKYGSCLRALPSSTESRPRPHDRQADDRGRLDCPGCDLHDCAPMEIQEASGAGSTKGAGMGEVQAGFSLRCRADNVLRWSRARFLREYLVAHVP